MIRKLVASVLIILMLCNVMSCSKVNVPSDYLGAETYDASISAMVYEQIPGEEDGFMGITYHEVTDINGLINQDEIAVCLYFYSSVNSSALDLTAGVEDLAQSLKDKVVIVAIDAFDESDLSANYEIEAYPEFVLVRNGSVVSKFGSNNYDVWYIDTVCTWLSDNGYEPDYSLL